jgi:hypothetical protein
MEQQVDLTGTAPDRGSCLVYGDSGLPNKDGPLAPDKIAFREGWSADSAYLLLNLRFTGWHRYKASNSITQLTFGSPVLFENLEGEPPTWLPEGRSLFRDKRVPRENLNSLLIPRSGMSAVLYNLTGVGGPWAQDPPPYARVERFETGPEVDTSITVLDDWWGWTHQRHVFFYHQGPVVIVDQAAGPQSQRSALSWHMLYQNEYRTSLLTSNAGERITVDPDQEGELPAYEVVFLPLEPGKARGEAHPHGSQQVLRVQWEPEDTGSLWAAAVFLPGDWAGADTTITQSEEGPVLTISTTQKSLRIPLDAHSLPPHPGSP